VLLPVSLLTSATLAAAVMAYGTHAAWAQFSYGFEFILVARRLQWPLGALSIVLCLAVLGLVIAGRRRAWWLIGLAPVLALFIHRFASDSSNRFHVVEDPPFVSAQEAAKFVGDADWVVGLRFGDHDYAYPYAALFETPVVIHAEHDRRLAVMWSAYANRALAVEIGRDLRGADLDVVSMPANALLLYNRRIGQFINGLTGLTPAGGTPDGVRSAVPLVKTTWKAWRDARPATKVLALAGPGHATAPRAPIRPTLPMPKRPAGPDLEARVVLVGVKEPAAFLAEAVTAEPLNLTADGAPALVFRNPGDGTVRAFDRRSTAACGPGSWPTPTASAGRAAARRRRQRRLGRRRPGRRRPARRARPAAGPATRRGRALLGRDEALVPGADPHAAALTPSASRLGWAPRITSACETPSPARRTTPRGPRRSRTPRRARRRRPPPRARAPRSASPRQQQHEAEDEEQHAPDEPGEPPAASMLQVRGIAES
jgi:hypothetical protein